METGRRGVAALGMLVAMWAPRATADLPHAIAVVDDASNRVLRFDPFTCAFAGEITPPDDHSLASPFACVIGVALFDSGSWHYDTLYISDLRLRRVTAFDGVSGRYLRPLISNIDARGLAWLPSGRLLVAAGRDGVRSFAADGTDPRVLVAPDAVLGPINAWDVLVRPFANGGVGDVLVSDATLDVILRFSLTGTRLPDFARSTEFRFVQQLAERENGNVLAVDPFAGAVFEFSPTGASIRTIRAARPRGVIESRGGALLVCAEDGVHEYTAEGEFLTTRLNGVPGVGPRNARYLRCRTPAIRGDMDGDGEVTFFDVDLFVLALSDPRGLDAISPNLDYPCRADINRDGRVDQFDLDPFVELFDG